MPTPFMHMALAQRLIADPALPGATRDLLRASWGTFLLGSIAPADLDLTEGPFKAAWLGPALVLARRVVVNGRVLIQGCWLDWENLRASLVESAKTMRSGPLAALAWRIAPRREPAPLSFVVVTTTVDGVHRSSAAMMGVPAAPRGEPLTRRAASPTPGWAG